MSKKKMMMGPDGGGNNVNVDVDNSGVAAPLASSFTDRNDDDDTFRRAPE